MIQLVTPRLRLDIEPDFGARINGLTDLRHGRNWLVPGPPVPGDTYALDQARGWDECFPTVAPCRSALRDHGDLWGRKPTLCARSETVSVIWSNATWRFSRDLVIVADDRIDAHYRVENLSPEPLVWMWSQHCLIAPLIGDRIHLSGFDDFASDGRDFAWPRLDGRDLSIAPAADAGWAVKAYARASGPVSARITDGTAGLAFDWDGATIPALGVWICHGGWHGGCQIALEPTTAPADDLDQARVLGSARTLAPGAAESWSVTLRLTGPSLT